MSSPNFKFINRGAILQEFLVGGQNIVLNFNTAEEYADNPSHFGATIGRVANRIANAKITSLNDKSVELEANNGPNSLHGGKLGWGKQEWKGPELLNVDGIESVKYKYLSRDGDQGFPGEVEVSVLYKPSEGSDGKVRLEMVYEAKLLGGAEETVVNITNHSYFNIGPHPTIAGTQALLTTNQHLPLDSTGIPKTTQSSPFPGIEANTAFTLTETEPNVDDCFVHPHISASEVPLDTSKQSVNICGKFYHPDTKIHLEVASTDPAFQFYTGKYVSVKARADGTPERVGRGGFCVEPSRYVDAVNRKEWRHMVVLKKGETYGSKIVYTAWKGEPKAVA